MSLLTLFSAAAVLGAPPAAELSNLTTHKGQLVRRTIITSNGTGTATGYYYSVSGQVGSGLSMDVNYGQYHLSWSSASGNFIAGMGWMPGNAQTIYFDTEFKPSGNAYLSLYGWTTDPLVEYYICQAYGTYNPGTGLPHMGTLFSDHGTYDIYKTVRVNASSILGTQTFNQYWSVRQPGSVNDEVLTKSNHFNAWASLGMVLGTFDYQIIATEGHQSNGSTYIAVY
ncbi:hypothetical protein GALMADRAFT_74760 [Galerina marginata CBS 339.88]|uniref:Endo-1,4-beta-xylanase n=1 Tax=Galerina marginata (strain CBS 339.88) TaxID=685588 RepID=A0A067SLG2_GALM3|nr:hypothetical protein GALMADRAFT_74760 [Galerina marginata CBS 339.88]